MFPIGTRRSVVFNECKLPKGDTALRFHRVRAIDKIADSDRTALAISSSISLRLTAVPPLSVTGKGSPRDLFLDRVSRSVS